MFRKTWSFEICQSLERPLVVASKYYELIEPNFETSYGNEATYGDVALVKQFGITS